MHLIPHLSILTLCTGSIQQENQFLLTLQLWVWISIMERCTRYNIMWWSLSVTCDRSVVYFRYSVSSTNKTDHHDIAEILLKLALSTITLTPSTRILVYYSFSIYEWIRCRTIKNIKYFFSNLTTGNTVINMFHVTRK